MNSAANEHQTLYCILTYYGYSRANGIGTCYILAALFTIFICLLPLCQCCVIGCYGWGCKTLQDLKTSCDKTYKHGKRWVGPLPNATLRSTNLNWIPVFLPHTWWHSLVSILIPQLLERAPFSTVAVPRSRTLLGFPQSDQSHILSLSLQPRHGHTNTSSSLTNKMWLRRRHLWRRWPWLEASGAGVQISSWLWCGGGRWRREWVVRTENDGWVYTRI